MYPFQQEFELHDWGTSRLNAPCLSRIIERQVIQPILIHLAQGMKEIIHFNSNMYSKAEAFIWTVIK